MIRTSLLTLLTAFSVTSTGFAGEDKNPISIAPEQNDNFAADFRIDGWIIQAKVDYTNKDFGLSKGVFLGFDDIISHVDWLVPLGADFRVGRFGFLPDLVALKISGGGSTPGPLFERANVELEMGVLNLVGYVRIIDQPNVSLDLLGGARYLWVDLGIGLSGGALGGAIGNVQTGTKYEIWDGVVGLRLQQDLTEKLFYTVYGDVGAGDSKLTYQIQADLGYRFGEMFSVSAGYRYLAYEEENSSAAVDLTASGPIITLNWAF